MAEFEKSNPLSVQVQALPDQPGVYHFYDENERILYVGKAKNLKKRVASYFSKQHNSGKTRVLVSKIRNIRHVVVANESDALLLENSMIKQHRPRYNVLLKDDKTYPWICVKNEYFPRVFTTRRKINDGSYYFGPYTSTKTVRSLIELIHSIYTLRTCAYELAPEQISSGKVKLCLEYHIGNCAGPCQGLQTESEYREQTEAIVSILKGNLRPSLRMLEQKMKMHAENLEFEKAQRVKDRIELLNLYQAKSQVVNPKITDLDVVSIFSDATHGYVNYMQIVDGAVVHSHTIELKKQLDESEEELLSMAVVELRSRFNSSSKTLLLPFPVAVPEGIKVEVPKLGDKKSLIDLSLRNAKFFRQDRFKQMKVVDPDRHTKRILAQMKDDLHLSQEPVHIECFDNSNLQGTNPASACVVFKNAKPSKADYRKFTIKSVEGPNDFASMEEVVLRRYRRLLQEEQPLPQLIVIDGGKGQLSSALKSLEALGLRGKIAIIGIAKRLEEIYFPGDSLPLYLDKKSETLKVIQQLRNEAHRFSLKHHREKRSATAITSELEQINGIGPATADKLLKHYKSVKVIRTLSETQLTEVVSLKAAKAILTHFRELN